MYGALEATFFLELGDRSPDGVERYSYTVSCGMAHFAYFRRLSTRIWLLNYNTQKEIWASHSVVSENYSFCVVNYLLVYLTSVAIHFPSTRTFSKTLTCSEQRVC